MTTLGNVACCKVARGYFAARYCRRGRVARGSVARGSVAEPLKLVIKRLFNPQLLSNIEVI